MRLLLLVLACVFKINCFAQLNDRDIRDLKRDRGAVDSGYVYALPYEAAKKYLFIQGANSKMSHANELSFDFKMKKGSAICAARGGRVIATKSDSDKGGLKKEFLDDGNHVIIEHTDGSTAHYWHLAKGQVFVSPGDTVKKGQVIASSGNTGYTAFPHLHFQIIDAKGIQLLPRFETQRGVRYLRPGRWYKAVQKGCPPSFSTYKGSWPARLPLCFSKVLISFPCQHSPGSGYNQVQDCNADDNDEANVECEHTEVLNKKTNSLPSVCTEWQFGISFT